MVHLTFYDNSTHHAIAKVSLLITESEDNNIFNVAFDGVYCAEVSDHLAEQNLILSAMLAYLLNFKKCLGFENVADEKMWLSITIMGSSAHLTNSLSFFLNFYNLNYHFITENH